LAKEASRTGSAHAAARRRWSIIREDPEVATIDASPVSATTLAPSAEAAVMEILVDAIAQVAALTRALIGMG
jgi:hypothetical protein